MTLNQLLLEAKATFRDTKNSRDSLILFLFGTLDLSKLNARTEKFLKDAAKVNALVSFVTQNVLGKTKGKNGKFTIGDADIKKLASLKFSLNDLSPSLAKQLGMVGIVGSNKFVKTKQTAVEVKTPNIETSKNIKTSEANKIQKTETKTQTVSKEAVVEDIKKMLGEDSVWNNQISWQKDERVTATEALKIAITKVNRSGLDKYFDLNKTVAEDSGSNYDPEWDDYARQWTWESFAPKSIYKEILRKLTVGGNDTGDYSGDWADSYIKVFLA